MSEELRPCPFCGGKAKVKGSKGIEIVKVGGRGGN